MDTQKQNARLPSGAESKSHRLTVLHAMEGIRLTKSYKADGSVSAYGDAKNYRVAEIEVSSIRNFATHFFTLNSMPSTCIIRGKFIGDEAAQAIEPCEYPGHYRRTNDNFHDQPLPMAMVDVDTYKVTGGIDPVLNPMAAINQFINTILPACFRNVTYCWQLSGSAGLPKYKGILKAHIWFWLSTPRTSFEMKQWAKATSPLIDASLFQQVQIHYTAAPIFDAGVADPVPVRVGLSEGLTDEVDLTMPSNLIDPDAGEISKATESELKRMVVSGENYHDSLLRLTALYASRNMSKPDTLKTIIGLMDSVAIKDDRWQERMDAVPGMIDSAEKFRPAPLSDDEKIQWLASLNLMEYDRVRKEQATVLNVQLKTLDSMVKAARNDKSEADRLPFAEVEPHPEPIDPAQLLSEVSDTIRLFIVLDAEQAHAAALWCALTWFIDVVEVAPLAIINAPEKSCGKTQLLTVLGRMAYRPLPASNASASALFRAVEAWKPTILIDEADTFFRDNFELHGMVNAGYLRDGFVLRSEAVGDTFEPRMFSVFSAKALAGIALEKHLPDATMSRGVVFNLRRKLSHETVSRLRYADRGLFAGIAEKLARFALDYSQQVRAARPSLPDVLSDRDQDNWDGLLAVASCAGDAWLARATVAALKLSGAGEKTVSTGNELLADIQHVFESKRVEKISTADLIAALCYDEENAWAAYNRGKQITPRQVARQLAGYGIASKNIRLSAYETLKGFELSQFSDVFVRYLSTPLNLPPHPPQTPEANKHGVISVADYPLQKASRYNSATPEAPPLLGCSDVADKKPILGGTEASRSNASHLRV